MSPLPLLLLLASTVSSQRPTECDPAVYNTLNETHRSAGYTVVHPETPLCDDTLRAGWYRFVSGAGGEMPEHCVNQQQCGTLVPLWMNGSHPAVAEGRVTRSVCANFNSGVAGRTPCCEQKVQVAVTNCGGFFVYYLQPTPSCPIAYCAGSRAPCPYGKWSSNGFPPCRDAHPDMPTVPKFTGPEIVNRTFRFSCEVQFSDHDPDVRFEIMWTFDNQVFDVSQLSAENLVNPIRIAYLEGHHLLGQIGKNIGCKARAYYVNNKDRAGPWVQSNVYWAGIRVSHTNLVVSEAELERNVTLTSTIPLVCNHTLECCIDIKLDITGRNIADGTAVAHNCKYLLCSTDWNSARKEASIDIPIIAARDQMPDGDQRLVLKFERLRDHGGGRYAQAFTNYEIDAIQVVVKDALTGLCRAYTDPNVRTVDGNWFAFQYLGDFTLFQNPSRNFEVQLRTTQCDSTGHGACACGVAIREYNDIIILDACNDLAFGRRYNPALNFLKPRDLSEGTVVQQSTDGRQYVVYMPSSAELKAQVIGPSINVDLTIPGIDRTHGRGLCGTFDGSSQNDFTHRNGQVDTVHSEAFVMSWSNEGETSLFRQTPLPAKDKTDLLYCQCDSSRATQFINCTARGDITGQILQCGGGCVNGSRIASCDPSIVLCGFEQNRRRQAGDEGSVYQDHDDPQNIFVYDPANYKDLPRTAPSWPTASGITEQEAETRCRQTVTKSDLWTHLQNTSPEHAEQLIASCKSDILYTDSYHFLEPLIDAVTTGAQVELAKDPSNFVTTFDGQNVLKPEVTEDICNIQCMRNGHCVKGQCVCNTGFTGDNCQLIAGIGPQLHNVSGSGVCDVTLRPCRKVFIEASNYQISDTFDCKVSEVLPDGSLSSDPFIESAEFITDVKLACPLPDAKVKSERSVKTFMIQVTSDGVLYGNQVEVTIYDSTCRSCNGSVCHHLPNTCLIHDLCYASGDFNPKDNQFTCNPTLDTSAWSPVPTIPSAYPVVTKVSLSGPNADSSLECTLDSTTTDSRANYKVSWYVNGLPYPRERELDLRDRHQAVYKLNDLPTSGQIVCKIRSFYTDRNILSPYVVSNVLDLAKLQRR